MNNYTVIISATSITLSAISPAQITFDPSLITSLYGYSIAKLVYDFGDGSDAYTVHSSNSANAISVPITHNFFRPTSADSATLTATILAYEYTTFASKQHNIILPLEMPTFPANAYYPLAVRAYEDKIIVVGEQVSVSGSQTFANIIVPASAQTYDTTEVAATCVDPTPLTNFSVTITGASQAVFGTAIEASAVSGTLVFVSDQGNYSSQYYSQIATAVNAITADGYLFGGNNNYPYGWASSVVTNWSGYASLVTQQVAFPALGMKDQIATGVIESVISTVLVEEDVWTYSPAVSSTLSYGPTAVVEIPWYEDGYDASGWASGTTPIGYGSGGYINTAIASTIPITINCAETNPITSLYARNTFTIVGADLTGADAVRIRYKLGAAIAIYINEVLVATDNLYTPYQESSPDPICAQIETTPSWRSAYVPLSCVSVGTNTIAIRAIQHPADTTSLFFDVSLSTINTTGIYLPVAPYGASQPQHFGYLPGNKRYYDVVFPGDIHLFVLNPGINRLSPCINCVEPDGFTIGSAQYLWFVDAILNSTSRWKVVMFHTPNIGSAVNSSEQLFREFDWGFDSLGVQLILNGGLGVNEHCIRNNIHYVNCSASTIGIASVEVPCAESAWLDVVENNEQKGAPAIVKISATQSNMQVDFLRASTSQIIHTFKIV